MDSSLIISLVIAVVAIVPGVWALVNQAKKDKAQATIDMNKAANDAAMAIISPLQTEVARLQVRVLELERALIDKTTEIGNLMQAGIDKDTQIRVLKYNLEGMELRLETFEKKRKTTVEQKKEEVERNQENTDNTNTILEKEFKLDKEKKKQIQIHTEKSIKQITGSSTNDFEKLLQDYETDKRDRERAEDLEISEQRRVEDLKTSEERRLEDIEAREEVSNKVIKKD